MSKQRISTAPIKRMALERGIETPNDLWRAIGKDKISLNTVKIWWADGYFEQLNVAVMTVFAEFYDCGLLDVVEEAVRK